METLRTVLEIAGVVVLSLLAIALLALLIAGVAGFRRLKSKLSDAAASSVPTEIRLVLSADATWPDPDLAGRLLAELAEEGFVLCGTYRIDPLHAQQLALLVGPDGCSAGAVISHPESGLWVDLWTVDASGNSVTFTTSGQVGTLDRPPWAERLVARPGASVAELVAAFRSQVPPDAVPISCDALAAQFADEWRREMVWRKARGVSVREAVKVARRKKTS